MAVKDVLLPLVGKPGEAAVAAIDKCIAVARDIGARVSALAIEQETTERPRVRVPAEAGGPAVDVAPRSISNARSLLKAFDAAASRFDIRSDRRMYHLATSDVPAEIVRQARLKDMSLVPVKADNDRSEKIVEHLLFESGRPVLICPEDLAEELPAVLDRVVIAWDHSAPAARAVADALPILMAAASVRILTVTDEKTLTELESGAALVNHLAEHGIKANFETVAVSGSSIGKILEAYVKVHAMDLLVMGAYRHSRLSETWWGGATKTVIGRPPCWVMMSH